MKQPIATFGHRFAFADSIGRPIKFYCVTLLALGMAGHLSAQVNSGSDGQDGALDLSSITITTNIVIDMHDHTNGVYQYTYVNIPANVTVSFIPNAVNSPVTWLVQSNAVINGTVDVSGQSANGPSPGAGGPGGWAGGPGGTYPGPGLGPGGGGAAAGAIVNGNYQFAGGPGSFWEGGGTTASSAAAGPVYGNSFLFPLMGGSGGGGSVYSAAGGGGGGAILIAVSNSLQLNGTISAFGRQGGYINNQGWVGGPGSGGGVRLVATTFNGSGDISVDGGEGGNGTYAYGGDGRIRIDAWLDDFSGSFGTAPSVGFQPIIVPAAGQGIQLAIASIGGVAVSPNPSGQLITPDAVIPGSETNPVPIVVSCTSVPLNTAITVTVDPQYGPSASAVGTNSTGTLASSTATIPLVIPRGGGIIYATAVTGN